MKKFIVLLTVMVLGGLFSIEKGYENFSLFFLLVVTALVLHLYKPQGEHRKWDTVLVPVWLITFMFMITFVAEQKFIVLNHLMLLVVWFEISVLGRFIFSLLGKSYFKSVIILEIAVAVLFAYDALGFVPIIRNVSIGAAVLTINYLFSYKKILLSA